MFPRIEVRHNLADVLAAYDELGDKLRDQAAVRALNRTATTVRAESARRIGRTYNMKIGAAKGQMTIDRAVRGRLTARIQVSGRPIPLIEFDARQVASGVSVKIKEGRKVVSHAFIATMKGGHVGVFERLARGPGSGRLPIRQLFSLSLPAAFTQKQVMDALFDVIRARFPEAVAQEIRYLQLRKNVLRLKGN